jgi:hypothetical protein
MPTSLNHQPEVHHPKSPAIRWAADYPICCHRPGGEADPLPQTPPPPPPSIQAKRKIGGSPKLSPAPPRRSAPPRARASDEAYWRHASIAPQ